jgi:hypothetical protein
MHSILVTHSVMLRECRQRSGIPDSANGDASASLSNSAAGRRVSTVPVMTVLFDLTLTPLRLTSTSMR